MIIVAVAWATFGFLAAFITGWIIIAAKGTNRVVRGVSSVVADRVSRGSAAARLDEIEALYASGRISDFERAEARARILVRR